MYTHTDRKTDTQTDTQTEMSTIIKHYTLDLFLIMLYAKGNITGTGCEAIRMDVSLAITKEMYRLI